MKIIFMGTPDFAVPCLQKIIDMGHTVLCVLTQPDKPKGRGQKLQRQPVAQLADKYDIPVKQPLKVKKNPELIEEFKVMEADAFVVVAYGRILPVEILELPRFGCINVHASLLPKYRGSAPIQWSIINGEKESGVTTMYMADGVDTGDMILKKKVQIKDSDTAAELHDNLSIAGAELLGETLELIEEGKAPRIAQVHEEATHVPMLEKSMGNIQWDIEAERINNLIRGTNPWPGAYTFYDGRMIKIFKIEILPHSSEEEPGTIIKFDNNGIIVATKDNNICIKEVQCQGKRRMTTAEFLNGNEIIIGTRFVNSAES